MASMPPMKSSFGRPTAVPQPEPAPEKKKSGPSDSVKHALEADDLPLITVIMIYWQYTMMIILGYIYDLAASWRGVKLSGDKEGYAPLAKDFEEFFRRRLYGRLDWCWNRPITGPASTTIRVFDRHYNEEGNLVLTGDTIDCLNLSSYNYLGFAEPGNPETEPEVLDSIDRYGVSTTASTLLGGSLTTLHELEEEIAKFLGVGSAMVFGMGWGTNSTAIPALVANAITGPAQPSGYYGSANSAGYGGFGRFMGPGSAKGTLLISDSMNHNSIVTGARASGATIRTFRHNDVDQLERVIRKAIIQGQPKTHREWRKIIIIVEGVYSMEGEVCLLKEIVELKKKYRCYMYLDEAHSIGAVGETGRGVCEYCNVKPTDVDLLMGTFTKSFGAIGGYVAGEKHTIDAIRSVCASHYFSSGLSPPCIAQVRAAFRVIQTESGKKRMKQLMDNGDFFRSKLRKAGLHIIGDRGNSVIPMIVGAPGRLDVLSNSLLRNGIAVVAVGFPATPLLTSRVRFCLSAGHTIEQLDKAADKIIEVAQMINCDHNHPGGWSRIFAQTFDALGKRFVYGGMAALMSFIWFTFSLRT